MKSQSELKELDIKIKLPKKLDQHLIYLETISKRSKDFIDAENQAKVAEWVEKKGEKHYTSEEVKNFLERRNLKELDV